MIGYACVQVCPVSGGYCHVNISVTSTLVFAGTAMVVGSCGRTIIRPAALRCIFDVLTYGPRRSFAPRGAPSFMETITDGICLFSRSMSDIRSGSFYVLFYSRGANNVEDRRGTMISQIPMLAFEESDHRPHLLNPNMGSAFPKRCLQPPSSPRWRPFTCHGQDKSGVRGAHHFSQGFVQRRFPAFAIFIIMTIPIDFPCTYSIEVDLTAKAYEQGPWLSLRDSI